MDEGQTPRGDTWGMEPQPEPFARNSLASNSSDSQSPAQADVHDTTQEESRGSSSGADGPANGDEGSSHDQDDETLASEFVDRELSSPPDDEGMSTTFIEDETWDTSVADETVQSEDSDGDDALFNENIRRTNIMHRRDPAEERASASLIADTEKQLRESIASRKRSKADLLYEKVQADLMDKLPEDDREFIINTQEQTPKAEVLRLKWDLIRERDDARKAWKELDEWYDFDNQLRQADHERRKKALAAKQRGKLHPPILGAHTRRSLYDNLADKLRECTVHTVLNRAFDNFMFHDFPRSEYYAKRARDLYATLLDYQPLSAWCQFHVGKAQFGQRMYDEALASFEEARLAGGLYVEKDLVEKWVKMTKESMLHKGDGGTSSAESGAKGEDLGDQPEGYHDSTSSKGSAGSGEARPRQQSLAEQLGEQDDSALMDGSTSSDESGAEGGNLADHFGEGADAGSTNGSANSADPGLLQKGSGRANGGK